MTQSEFLKIMNTLHNIDKEMAVQDVHIRHIFNEFSDIKSLLLNLGRKIELLQNK